MRQTGFMYGSLRYVRCALPFESRVLTDIDYYSAGAVLGLVANVYQDKLYKYVFTQKCSANSDERHPTPA